MSDISTRARFDIIRYAQVWEDADVLIAALRVRPGDHVLSIASAGDNALALLVADPASVTAIDLSLPQLHCLRLRIGAYRVLDHTGLLELIGSRQSDRRGELLDRVLREGGLPADCADFWAALRPGVIAHGAGGVGKFEHYFRIFRNRVLPWVHGRSTIDALLTPMPPEAREAFHDRRWANWRWRLMLRLFFSQTVMGRLGRDPAFFTHAQGSLSDQVAARTRHAFTALDPSENPYLHWILKGCHGTALPMALRPEHFATIRDRLDRLTPALSPLETFESQRFDAFNLSDIFEYLDPDAFAKLYGTILNMAAPGARLAYWNMMVPRRAPEIHEARIERKVELDRRLHAEDKAFFYSDFVVERVR